MPLFHEATLGNGNTTLTIKEFRPAYVQTTFWGCKSKGCDLEWDPGESLPNGASNVRIETWTAIAFPAGSTPTKITDAGPGIPNRAARITSKAMRVLIAQSGFVGEMD